MSIFSRPAAHHSRNPVRANLTPAGGRPVGTARRRGSRFRAGLLLPLMAVVSSCAHPVVQSPSLPFEQHTLRIHLDVDRDGFAALSAYEPLTGRIGLRQILEAEKMWPRVGKKKISVQLLVHYGRFYVVAEGFKAVWEITPKPGTGEASFRPAASLGDRAGVPARGVRLSRYGSAGLSCLRIDRENGPTVYITSLGQADDHCH
ncbi:MAG TPA: hypothetical protein VGR67_09255 [Candidatus Polarisedimenticolia bacterium]|nr:hypothetical protein [Candidatus Polarisedimenticolia bacterium]